jgi:hypothetical protein
MDLPLGLKKKNKEVNKELDNFYNERYRVRDLYHIALWSMCGKREKISLNDYFVLKKGELINRNYSYQARLGALTCDTNDYSNIIKRKCDEDYIYLLRDLMDIINDMPLYNFPSKEGYPRVSIKISDSKVMIYNISFGSIIIRSFDREFLQSISNDKSLNDITGIVESVGQDVKEIDVRSDYEDIRKYDNDISKLLEKTSFKIENIYQGLDKLEDIIIDEFEEEIVTEMI